MPRQLIGDRHQTKSENQNMSVNFTDDAGHEGWEASGGLAGLFIIGQALMAVALPSRSDPNVSCWSAKSF